jgi:hypothetical protein
MGVPYWVEVSVASATVLTALTAFVAALSSAASKRAADRAQQSALSAWEGSAAALREANELSKEHHRQLVEEAKRNARSSYAFALENLSSKVLSRRLSGVTLSDIDKDLLNEMLAITESQIKLDEPTGRKFGRWVVTHARHAKFGDVDGYLNATQLSAKRVRAWTIDPGTALQDIRDNPGFENPYPADPGDESDYRIP